MRNFRGEIGRKIRYKMLSFKRIGFHFKMTNENVRLNSSFLWYKVTTKKWNAEECSNRFDLQRFHLSCRLFPTPP